VSPVRPASRIVLASGSPRRRELVERLGVPLRVQPADIDETPRPGEDARAYVHRLSVEKAAAVPAEPDELVIAADTTVDVDGDILAKPDDADDARRMLRAMSGRDHLVHTGVTVRLGEAVHTAVVTTRVSFAALSDADVEWYVATGEPFDKAGAYALQGVGGVFVRGVTGSVSNVVGLPMADLVALARAAGVDLLG
jgi:septum formation protein